MSRLVLALLVLVASAPVAAAGPAETVSAAEAAVRALWADLVAVITPVNDHAAPAPSPEETPEEETETSARGHDEEAAGHDREPTYRNDLLLGDAGPGAALVLRPVVAAVEDAPVAGAPAASLLARLGLRDADAAAPAEARAAPLAPASAAAAPASDLPAEASAVGLAVAAVAAAGAAGAATGLAPALWEKARRLAAFVGVALYTRLARQDLLDHAVRDRIYATVRDRPGVTLAELAEAGGVGRTAASYHLRVLQREGMVASRRDGRVRRFHANGTALEDPARLAALGHPLGEALAQAVRAEPGQDQSSLAARLGLSPSLAHWHLKRLEAANVVQKVRDGRKVRYFPAAA